MPYTHYVFLSRVGCFRSCSCSQKKNENLDYGRDSLYFQVLPWRVFFMRVPPLPGGHQTGASSEEAQLVNTILNQPYRHHVSVGRLIATKAIWLHLSMVSPALHPPEIPSHTFFLSFFFHLTYSRWTSSLPSCLWSQRIFPSLPGSRLTIFYRDASSALLQLVNQWLNFTYSRSHAFRYERKNTNPTLVRIELTTSVLADVQLTY